MNDRPDNLHDHSYSESTAISRPQSVAVASSRTSTSHDPNPGGNHHNAFELHQIETHEDDEPWSLSSAESRVITRRSRSVVDQRSIRSQPPRKGLAGWVQKRWARNVVMTVPENKNRDHFGEPFFLRYQGMGDGACGMPVVFPQRGLSYPNEGFRIAKPSSPGSLLLISSRIALERTFLAYIRTSVVLAMQGVLVAQLFRLQRESTANDRLGYYEVGIPLSVSCHAVAIAVAVIGAYRFFKQQHAVALGKIYAGGWELNCIAGLFAAVSLISPRRGGHWRDWKRVLSDRAQVILVTFVLSLVIAVEIDMDHDNATLMA